MAQFFLRRGWLGDFHRSSEYPQAVFIPSFYQPFIKGRRRTLDTDIASAREKSEYLIALLMRLNARCSTLDHCFQFTKSSEPWARLSDAHRLPVHLPFRDTNISAQMCPPSSRASLAYLLEYVGRRQEHFTRGIFPFPKIRKNSLLNSNSYETGQYTQVRQG